MRLKRRYEHVMKCPDFKPPLSAAWLLAVHVREIWLFMPEIKAYLTSTYGTVIKIDSTKKICKKLAGHCQGNAEWLNSVSNEKGEILACILHLVKPG